jgi:hypothetical protein
VSGTGNRRAATAHTRSVVARSMAAPSRLEARWCAIRVAAVVSDSAATTKRMGERLYAM